MSQTILGGNFTVYYLDENRQKRIKWSGSASATNTANVGIELAQTAIFRTSDNLQLMNEDTNVYGIATES